MNTSDRTYRRYLIGRRQRLYGRTRRGERLFCFQLFGLQGFSAGIRTLALGIGFNATVFTFVNAVLIRGLPFDDPGRILALSSRDLARNRRIGVSCLDFKDWQAATQTFRSLAAYLHRPDDERQR